MENSSFGAQLEEVFCRSVACKRRWILIRVITEVCVSEKFPLISKDSPIQTHTCGCVFGPWACCLFRWLQISNRAQWYFNLVEFVNKSLITA